MSKHGDREHRLYWDRRLFRNSYTRAGRTHRVAGWHVKIQWEGVRRTFRLPSTDRGAAAAEALALYREIRRQGWPAAAGRIVPGLRAAEASVPVAEGVEPRAWVTTRKYVGNLHQGFARELFASLSHDGRTEHVALGTEDANTARLRAEEMQGALEREGWRQFNRSHAREATVAVFWCADPMACTYTTFLTIPARFGGTAPPGRPRAAGWRVLVIEPEEDVRRALLHWLRLAPGIACVEGVASPAAVNRKTPWHVVLANREQPAAALRDLVATGGLGAGTRLLTHGVFADSDAIFASFSGVRMGYLLRRLPPSSILAPVMGASPEGPPTRAAALDRRVFRYFQAIFEPKGDVVPDPTAPEFTHREREILDLLSRGFADKEIGAELGISVWTVHSHLKRIFVKYGVRTRTEAVVKHLQK